MAVDNNVLLELGYGGRGAPAENHHVAPLHPEYAELPPQKVDPAAAKALMDEAGMGDFEHELMSIDDAWRKDTTDAVAAQLRQQVHRRGAPGHQRGHGRDRQRVHQRLRVALPNTRQKLVQHPLDGRLPGVDAGNQLRDHLQPRVDRNRPQPGLQRVHHRVDP